MTSLAEKIETQQMSTLLDLISWAGSQHNLAVLMGTSDQVVAQWKVRGKISKAGAAQIELITKGRFTHKMLLPSALDII